MMQSAFWGELVGTAIVILMGNGVVACVLLKGSFGHGSGWIVVTAGWGFAVIAGVFTALAVGSHAHLNPAVTIGVAMASGDWSLLPIYIPAQLLGAMLGASFVWLHYLPHWRLTDDAGSKRACFCTAPAVADLPANVLSEIIGTAVLIIAVASISSKVAFPTGLSPGVGPFIVGLLVWGIGLSLGGTTGYAINPARDLGPRIMHSLLPIAGKGSSEWHYAIVPIAGPIIGASIGGLIVRVLGICC